MCCLGIAMGLAIDCALGSQQMNYLFPMLLSQMLLPASSHHFATAHMATQRGNDADDDGGGATTSVDRARVPNYLPGLHMAA